VLALAKRPAISPDGPRHSAAPAGKRVLLVCVPFQNPRLSSLSTALLATLLRSHGHDCREAYVHFEFARMIGMDRYRPICTAGGAKGLTGEMLFAESYHGSVDEEGERRLSALFGEAPARAALMEAFERYCLERIAAAQPDLVGMSTSCNQLMPSLWLARTVKRSFPQIQVVLGGSACSEPMGARVKEFYPHIDYVVSGYGEAPMLALAQGQDIASDGVLVNEQSVNLNDLPVPDYTTFLAEAKEFAENHHEMMLAFEASRGCWWGQKHHCTFCGLNGTEMAFNMKTSERTVSEVRNIWERYGYHLFATDTILARDHLKRALPALARHEDRPRLFFEVKANMTTAEVDVLHAANVRWIQPGIESLSTRLLQLLDKGVTAIQNLALLKWCRELRIRISWSVLCGIPGEHADLYHEQIALMDKIPHLQPAGGAHPIRIDRYSPYFEKYAKFGWKRLEPLPEYQSLHPHVPPESLPDLAYHFNGVGGVSVTEYIKELQHAIDRWHERHARGDGLFWDPNVGLIRIDGEDAHTFEHTSVLERVLKHSHEIIYLEELAARAECAPQFLDELVSLGILFVEGKKAVNLAVRLGRVAGMTPTIKWPAQSAAHASL
jgi:ribosomal peptide maturation radical SAM protein 1